MIGRENKLGLGKEEETVLGRVSSLVYKAQRRLVVIAGDVQSAGDSHYISQHASGICSRLHVPGGTEHHALSLPRTATSDIRNTTPQVVLPVKIELRHLVDMCDVHHTLS